MNFKMKPAVGDPGRQRSNNTGNISRNMTSVIKAYSLTSGYGKRGYL